MKHLAKDQDGAIGLIIVGVICVVIFVGIYLYITTFFKKNPSATDIVTPSSQGYNSAVIGAKNVQNKYQAPVTQP